MAAAGEGFVNCPRRKDRNNERQAEMLSPATRQIAILEAQGYRLHYVDGDEYYFIKEDSGN
jgi:hypothetical protein